MRQTLLAAAAATVLCATTAASAANVSFTFQPCGNNSCAISDLVTLDWQPGNILAVDGAGGGAILPAGAKITDYYQANLTGALDGSSNVLWQQGTGGVYLTVVAGFGEIVSPASGGVTNIFNFDPTNPTNFFKVYLNGTGGTNLTGANFTSGIPVIEGFISSVFSNVSAQSIVINQDGSISIVSAGAFDQFDADGAGGNPADDYPGITSIGVSGSANVNAVITAVNNAYFPDLAIDDFITAAFTTGNLLAPFQTVDPSSAFSSDGVNSANFAHNIGTINGINGENFQFQADTSTVFTRQQVPEPTSIALVGLALLAGAGAGAMRRKRSAA